MYHLTFGQASHVLMIVQTTFHPCPSQKKHSIQFFKKIIKKEGKIKP